MTAAATVPSRRYVEHVMGLPFSLALRGRHAADARGAAAWQAAVAVLREADQVFSTYRTDSVVSRLGRGEITLAGCSGDVAAQVAEVLALGAAAERASGGAFAVRRGGALDPSGVVKGWAAERAAAHLLALPDTDFCLSAGGDVTCRTLDPAARPWRIGIEDPHDTGRLVAVVPVHTGAVATSGTARRGRRRRHRRLRARPRRRALAARPGTHRARRPRRRPHRDGRRRTLRAAGPPARRTGGGADRAQVGSCRPTRRRAAREAAR